VLASPSIARSFCVFSDLPSTEPWKNPPLESKAAGFFTHATSRLTANNRKSDCERECELERN
jgi:hypothetical protein